MFVLFDIESNTITYHLKGIYESDELEDLGRIVNAFLELADDRDILKVAGKISMAIAKDHAETEFEKYRIVQNRLFQSDFDKMLGDSNV